MYSQIVLIIINLFLKFVSLVSDIIMKWRLKKSEYYLQFLNVANTIRLYKARLLVLRYGRNIICVVLGNSIHISISYRPLFQVSVVRIFYGIYRDIVLFASFCLYWTKNKINLLRPLSNMRLSSMSVLPALLAASYEGGYTRVCDV